MTSRNEKDGVEHTFYVSRFLEFVDIGMKPAERRTSGLILGRVIYIRMETEPNAFAKHFFFFSSQSWSIRSIFSTSADRSHGMSRIIMRTAMSLDKGQLVIHRMCTFNR